VTAMMLPYQKSVMDEKAAVDQKILELGSFLNSPEANKVKSAERYWMVDQLKWMRLYSKALAKRIETY
jgi:hypothetical protein